MNRTIRWGIFTNCLIRSYIAGIYWTLVTAGYLAWSFWSGEWNRTWIIWPVAVAHGYAAVGFGIIKQKYPRRTAGGTSVMEKIRS